MPLAPSLRSLVLLLLATPLVAQEGSPGGPIPVASLLARRAAFLTAMPKGIAMIESGKIKSVDGDFPQDADYRESNDFLYLTGVESPGGRLIFIQQDSGSTSGKMLLYLAPPPAKRDAWSAPRIYADTQAVRLTGLAADEILPLPRVVMPPRAPGTPIPTTRPDPIQPVVDSLLTATALTRIDYRRTIGPLRAIKDADEIRRLRLASEISAEGHRAAMLNTRPGMWEYKIEAIVEYTFRRRGAERVGYPSIVGTGFNSTTLHYDLSRYQTKPGDVVLIDAAAEFGYYSADLTRTFPVSGKFTPRQKAIYELVLGAQQAAIDAVKPGVTLATLNQIARAYIKEQGGTLCGAKSCDTYFIHGLSHMVGMNVHDVNPNFTELRPGMTFTIEPGVYLPEESLGVRIEDVILVTANGSESLTNGAPRSVAEIEKLMAEGKKRGLAALKP